MNTLELTARPQSPYARHIAGVYCSFEVDAELGDWWTRFQEVGDDERTAMLKADSSPKPRRKRKRRKPGEAASEAPSA